MSLLFPAFSETEIGNSELRLPRKFAPSITLLNKVLALAASTLPTQQRSSEAKVKLATGILEAAAGGERDPDRLRAAGLVVVR